MASKSDVPLHGASLRIVRQCGRELEDVLQSKFGCKVEIRGVDFERDASLGQGRKPTIVPEERFSFRLNGVKVSVWKADLTNFKVDAVVNAANKFLNHAGGLASALCDAGGPEIQRESDEYTRKYGSVKTGDAIVTNAGKLQCKKLIHAVGPNLPMHSTATMVNQAKPLLSKAVRSILAVAEKHNLCSVAIPALSSGLFNFPLPLCADTIVTALTEYLPRLPCDIFLVNHDEPSVSEMERACRQITAGSPSSYSQAAGGRGRGADKTSEFRIEIGNVRLTLKMGSIEEQRADVIVNTISPELNLSRGEISKALSEKAGREMQKEIRERKKHLTRLVIVTQSYKLNCTEVYHTLCTPRDYELQDQILYEAITDCLKLAANKHHRSIAFPAIGTGNLGLKKNVAAQIITNAVENFTHRNPHKMEIYFVIHPSAIDTFKAFEAEMKRIQDRTSHHSPSHGFEHSMDFNDSRASTPLISLSSTSSEETDEAVQWLQDLFQSSGSFTVRNNFIQYFGEQEFQQLSRKVNTGVFIEEFFDKGCAGIRINGAAEHVAVVQVQVEAMLSRVQMEFLNEEKRSMSQMSTAMSTTRKPVPRNSSDFSNRESLFKRQGLQIIRIDKLENLALEELFELKKKQLRFPGSPQKMYQRIPAQFCQMVSQIGFHREYTPPDDAKYGEGIYFTQDLTEAKDLWKNMTKDKYLYFVEAQVLTGKSTAGKPGLIVPPPVGQDPVILYDSLRGGSNISVIFNGHQALPSYIIICKKY